MLQEFGAKMLAMQRRGAEHGARACAGLGAHFLLELREAGLPPAVVGVVDRFGEARVVVVHRVDDGGVALTNSLDAAERGVTLRGQARHLRDAVLVHGRHAGHGIGREIRGELEARDLADVLAIERRELVAR